MPMNCRSKWEWHANAPWHASLVLGLLVFVAVSGVSLGPVCGQSPQEHTDGELASALVRWQQLYDEVEEAQSGYEARIKDLGKNDPAFRPKDNFETTKDYLTRVAPTIPKATAIWHELLAKPLRERQELLQRRFLADSVKIELQPYEADKGQLPLVVHWSSGERKGECATYVVMPPEEARAVVNQWNTFRPQALLALESWGEVVCVAAKATSSDSEVPIRTPRVTTAEASQLVFDPAGQRMALINDGTLYAGKLCPGGFPKHIYTSRQWRKYQSVAIAPGGRVALAVEGTNAESTDVIDLVNMRITGTVSCAGGHATFSPDGRFASINGTLVDLETATPLLALGKFFEALWTEDGSIFLASDDKKMVAWSMSTFTPAWSQERGANVDVRINAGVVVVAGMYAWDIRNVTSGNGIPFVRPVYSDFCRDLYSADASPDGKYMVVSGGGWNGGSVLFYRKSQRPLVTWSRAARLRFTPDSQYLVDSGGVRRESGIQLYRVATLVGVDRQWPSPVSAPVSGEADDPTDAFWLAKVESSPNYVAHFVGMSNDRTIAATKGQSLRIGWFEGTVNHFPGGPQVILKHKDGKRYAVEVGPMPSSR